MGQGTRSLYIFDLRRLREQLADLGLDWDLPPYPPAKPEELNPVLAPRLQVELIDAEWTVSREKMLEYDSRQAAKRLSESPTDAEAHFRLGAYLLHVGKPDEAYKHLSRAIEIRPDMDEALHPLALAAGRLGRCDEAVAWASACLKKCPFESGVRDIRGQVRMLQKRHAEAVEDFSFLVATYPGAPYPYEQRATCYEALGKHDLARADRAQSDKVAGRRRKDR